MANITGSFAVALDDCEIQDITAAFRFWLKNNSTMPTPADIRAIAIDESRARKDRERPLASKALPAPQSKRDVVPWYGWTFAQITADADMTGKLRAHLETLGKDRAADYLKYLKNL